MCSELENAAQVTVPVNTCSKAYAVQSFAIRMCKRPMLGLSYGLPA